MTDDRDIEKLLESVAPAPAPAVLKTRILTAVGQRQETRRILSPLLRWCLAGCAVTLVFSVVADAGLGRGERRRLQALLAPAALTEDPSRDLAELGDALDAAPGEAALLGRMLPSDSGEPGEFRRSLRNAMTYLEEDLHGQKN